MGKIANCCCTCYIPDNYELPTITKTGWTASSWNGTCCKCMTLTPSTQPDWIDCCSSDFFNEEVTFTSTYNVFYQLGRRPLSFDGNLPFPGLDFSYFCRGEPFVAIDYTTSKTTSRNFKLLSGLRYDKIEVCVSKQEVSCGSNPPSTKWIVVSRYFFYYDSFLVWGRSSTSDLTINAIFDCLSVDTPEACEQNEAVNCDFLEVKNYVDDGIPGNINAVRLKSGYGFFTRVKFYDSIPTGTITFNNADVPGDCNWGTCGSREDFDDEFCINVSSLPSIGMLSNCGCNTSNHQLPNADRFIGSQSSCAGCFQPEQKVFATFCYDDVFDIQCIDCGDFTTCSPDGWSHQYVSNDPTGPFSECPPNYDFSWTSFGCSVPSLGIWQYKTLAESPLCYFETPCGSSGQKYDYVQVNIFDITAPELVDTTWDRTCDFVPVACCFTAQSWSVNFN